MPIAKIKELSQTQMQMLGWIRRQGFCSRSDLGRFFELAAETVSRLLKPMLENEILYAESWQPPNGQRRQSILKINPGFACALGVEIGFTEMRMGVVDLGGNIIRSLPAQSVVDLDPEACVRIIQQTYQNLIHEHQTKRLLGIGVAYTGGFFNTEGIVHRRFPRSKVWEPFPLRTTLQNGCSGVVEVIHDTVALMLAEMRYGHALRNNNVLQLMMVDGIGLSLLSNGMIHLGRIREGCEFGHLRVIPSGPYCYCGGTGCLESLASSWAILKEAQERIQNGVLTRWLTEEKASTLDLQILSHAATKGEVFAQGILNKAGDLIGRTLATVANIFDPEKVILSGILAEENNYPTLVHSLRGAFQNSLQHIRPGTMELMPSKLGRDGITIAGATTLFERLIPVYPQQLP